MCASGALHRVVAPKRVDTRLAGEEEVALLLELHVGWICPWHLKRCRCIAQKLQAIERKLHIRPQAELLANATGTPRSTGVDTMRVPFDDRNAKRRRGECKVVGDARPDDASAGHDNVELVARRAMDARRDLPVGVAARLGALDGNIIRPR